jgi:hypothetical protein
MKKGDIVRYDSGSTAFFMLEEYKDYGNGQGRWYGIHCLGGISSGSPENLKPIAKNERVFIEELFKKLFDKAIDDKIKIVKQHQTELKKLKEMKGYL